MINKLLHDTYKDYIETKQMNPELRRALRTSSRYPGFLNNLQKEMDLLEKGGKVLTREQVVFLVHSLTDVFMDTVDQLAGRRAESAFAKEARRAAVQRKKEIELAEKGIMTGDFEDAGVKIVDKSI